MIKIIQKKKISGKSQAYDSVPEICEYEINIKEIYWPANEP
jgi:hypothetical protein